MDEKVNKIAGWLDAGSINIFGRPFSGKDTQGRQLAGLLGGELIGGGDILRSHHDPQRIEQIMASGGIIPSDFYLQMIMPYLSRPQLRGKPLILSSVGRSHGEEPTIMKATTDSGHPMKAVILLRLTEAEAWRRFEAAGAKHDRGHRTDDHREVLKTRLKKFDDKTMPVIDFYRYNGLLIEVDGALAPDEVTGEIINSLAGRASAVQPRR